MNELWSEADSIVFKALDGKSSYVIDHKTRSAGGDNFIRGKEFFFYTASNHNADDPSPLYYVLEAHKTAWNAATIPPTYNQTTYDTKANAARLDVINEAHKWILADDPDTQPIPGGPLGLDFSLKAHTREVEGETLFLWDRGQPNPERRWRYAVAEIIIGDATAGKFEFNNDFDKYNCFKIHNLTPNFVEFYFGTESSHNYSVSLEPWGQICVRRDSVTEGYDSTYRYFFKCNVGDPRFLHFKSHTGFVPDSMRANNITNASYIYNLVEVVGERGLEGASNRIVFDPHTYTDVTDDYQGENYIPTISSSTLVGDLIFHKGDLSFFRSVSTSTTPETGLINFDGFNSLATNLAKENIAVAIGNNTFGPQYKIFTAPNHDVFYLWQKSTNLLTLNDSPRVLNLGKTTGSSAVLETDLLTPTAWFGLDGTDPIQTNGIGTDIFAPKINAAVTSVQDFITLYQNELNNYATTSNEIIKLTTEGPILFATESWEIAKNVRTVNIEVFGGTLGQYETADSYFNGFNINHYFEISYINKVAKLDLKTDRSLAYRVDGYESRSGWPSSRFKHHRMFEGPKHTKKYQNRGNKYIHLDIENDPSGSDGDDFKLKDIENVIDSTVAFQTCAVETKIEPWEIDITSTPSYPLTVPGDISYELELAKNKNSISTFQSELTGDDKFYIRLNLLKEHFNDMVTLLGRATKIRPVCFDEVYFGDLNPAPSKKGVLNSDLMPDESYATFENNSAEHALYQRLEIPIFGKDEYPVSKLYGSSDELDKADLDKYKWVKIKDVKTRANELGFKFRYEAQFNRWLQTSELWFEPYYRTVFEQKTFGSWKSPVKKPILTSDSYYDEKTNFSIADGVVIGSPYNETVTPINILNAAHLTSIRTANFDSNKCVVFYLYDDTRTTETRAKIAFKQISSRLEDQNINFDFDANDSIFESEIVFDISKDKTPWDDENAIFSLYGQIAYFCQVNAPVTHSITPVAVPSTGEENTNQFAGLHQIIFRK